MNFRETDLFCICDFETTGVNPDEDYPIEVGLIVCDHRFVIVDTYTSIIANRELIAHVNGDVWPDDMVDAYNVHQIPFLLVTSGKHPLEVVEDIHGLLQRARNQRTVKRKILVSDNAQFEYRFMRRLFGDVGAHFPFHYCAWDTSLLLDGSGVGDPRPDHRALADCALLYRSLVMAFERLGWLDEPA